MCNTYRITPRRAEGKGIRSMVSDAAGRLGSGLVRKSDPGIVVLADERVEVMRWGFHRSFNPSINNARCDKLADGMWAEAFRQRRCVIPMSLFYEWGPAVGGSKQAHAFSAPDDDYLWVAGLWEEHAGFGPCYSMVTTAAPPLMAPIHHRMPALLRPDEIAGFLDSEIHWTFRPFDGPLTLAPCPSPLKQSGSPPGQQQLGLWD